MSAVMVSMGVLIHTFSSGIHTHPVSWNCAYHLRMELSDGGCFPNLVWNCYWTIVPRQSFWVTLYKLTLYIATTIKGAICVVVILLLLIRNKQDMKKMWTCISRMFNVIAKLFWSFHRNWIQQNSFGLTTTAVCLRMPKGQGHISFQFSGF